MTGSTYKGNAQVIYSEGHWTIAKSSDSIFLAGLTSFRTCTMIAVLWTFNTRTNRLEIICRLAWWTLTKEWSSTVIAWLMALSANSIFQIIVILALIAVKISSTKAFYTYRIALFAFHFAQVWVGTLEFYTIFSANIVLINYILNADRTLST